MTEVQRAAADKELRDGYRELQRKQAEVQDDFNARRNEEMSRLQRVLLEEVGVYAKAQGFDLVLAEGVIYATSSLDITVQHPDRAAEPPCGCCARSRACGCAEARGEALRRAAIAGSPASAVTWSLGELAVRFRLRAARRPGDARRFRRHAGGRPCVRRLCRQCGISRRAAGHHARRRRAGCRHWRRIAPTAALVHRNPHATFARIAALLHPAARLAPGHRSRRHGSIRRARVDPTAQVGPFALIGAGAVIGSAVAGRRRTASSARASWSAPTRACWPG